MVETQYPLVSEDDHVFGGKSFLIHQLFMVASPFHGELQHSSPILGTVS